VSVQYSKGEVDRIWHLYSIDKLDITIIAKRLGRSRKSIGEQVKKKKEEYAKGDV